MRLRDVFFYAWLPAVVIIVFSPKEPRFATNSYFLITISLYPDGINL